MSDGPRITFGIIVLNGEPFTRYCLRALYPFAHEIIVVEGAVRDAMASATPDGHSTDDTLAAIEQFKKECDPRDIVQIVTREGPWQDLTSMSQAYAQRATGDYLWQVDIDEFYHPDDMCRISQMLGGDPSIAAMSFDQRTFWGGLDWVVDLKYDVSYSRLWRGRDMWHRLFKWGPGFQYVEHEPPTVLDDTGIDCRRKKWLRAKDLARLGIRMYHYPLVFPAQVHNKCKHYASRDWGDYSSGVIDWAERNYLAPLTWPFRMHYVHIHPSWLEPFGGEHPLAVIEMMADIRAGNVHTDLRDNSDIVRLLSLKSYRVLRWALKRLACCRVVPGRLYRWTMHVRYDHETNSLRWR